MTIEPTLLIPLQYLIYSMLGPDLVKYCPWFMERSRPQNLVKAPIARDVI
jgi:hypothetical protein